ncbi:MAG TPA: hypothetical protein VMP03_04945, partial [Methylomirabilota bacterium]|nr:hypothetical protein [Methylomirabilota bacterium]
MRSGSAAIRLAAGVALGLALMAAFAPFAGSRAMAQDNGLASITIYTAICPPGFDGDDYGECYDNPGANIEYWLTGPAFDDTVVAETGASGFTAFENIDVDGEYALQIQIPGDFVSIAAFCSAGGSNFPFEYDEIVGTILLDLTTSDDLRCDFYITPDDQGAGSANLTIHNRVCPVGFTGPDFFNACHDNPVSGQVFYLDSTDGPQGTTNAAGDVTFAGLAPDSYFVFGGPPGDFIDVTAIFCAPTAAPGAPFPFSQDDGEAGFTIALAGGDDVTCDFYSVPVDQGAPDTGTLTIYKATCP